GYITPDSFVKAEAEMEEPTENEAKSEKIETKKAAPKKEKVATPKVKAATSSAKSAPKSTHRKMG
ncbi:MAG: hypothetical protein WBY99_05895, partial [Kaistella sp.]